MIEISLDESDLQRGLGQLLRNATETGPMMKGIAAELASLTEDNFESESWGGKRWGGDNNGKSKRAMADGGKTLQLSGQLAASISTKSGNGYARIGSNKVYAAIHHFGGETGSRAKRFTLPARPYLPIDGGGKLQPGGEDKLLQVVLDALSRGV